MGQELTSMCSCFDNIQESKQEMHILTGNNDFSKPNLSENNEIEGFSYSYIKSNIDPAISSFTTLIEEGITGYDVIIDKEECKVYSKEASDGYILKYTWNIPYSAKEFMEFMDKADLRKTWDANIDIIQVLGQYSPEEEVVYTKYKKFLTFDPRETLAFSKVLEINGNLADVTFSVESEKYPVTNGTVRVKLFVAGLYTEEILPDQQGNFTRITCVSHMDVGLPRALNNVARKFAGTTIPPITKKIVTQLKKFYEGQV